MPDVITATPAPTRADYQAAAEQLGASKNVELGGWTIVKDAHALYWRAYRELPCTVTLGSASPIDLSVGMAAMDLGLKAVRRG